jgi:hypothetical protein
VGVSQPIREVNSSSLKPNLDPFCSLRVTQGLNRVFRKLPFDTL